MARCALLPLVCVTAPAYAQATTETADARAIVLEPGAFIKVQDMIFGRIARPATAGTAVLTPAAAPGCTTTGGVVRTGTCQAAAFAGDASLLFYLRVTRPAGGQIFLSGPGGATMRVNNFTFGGTSGLVSLGSTTTEQRYLVLSGNGNFGFYVGGTLNVGANQAGGNYSGTFTLQVNYN